MQAFPVENLTFAYQKKKQLFNSLSLNLGENEKLLFLGSNGSGKSTLFKILAGLCKDSSGYYKKVSALDSSPVISYVPQFFTPLHYLPLRVDNLLEVKSANQELIALKQRFIEIFDLDAILRAQLAELSGGQFRRAMICRALLREPDLLILDEPEQNLDSVSLKNLVEVLSQYKKHKEYTLLLSSHSYYDFLEVVDRVIYLEKGTVCCSISSKDLKVRPAPGLENYSHLEWILSHNAH